MGALGSQGNAFVDAIVGQQSVVVAAAAAAAVVVVVVVVVGHVLPQ